MRKIKHNGGVWTWKPTGERFEVELEIDLDAVVKEMTYTALRSKGRVSTRMSRAIVLRATPIKEKAPPDFGPPPKAGTLDVQA